LESNPQAPGPGLRWWSGVVARYQIKGGRPLRLGSKGRLWSVCGWQVKLCGPLVTHASRIWAL